jgi:response regulator RpfG family c-di-GMP phosphodiesterase
MSTPQDLTEDRPIATAGPQERDRPRRLLVVDDDETVRDTLRDALGRAGYLVEVAPDASAAIDHLKQQHFDLVFADVTMPGMDGIQLCRIVSRIYPTMPIVVITGHGSVELARKALRRGATDFTVKPFNIDELPITVERNLERRRLESERLFQRTEEVMFEAVTALAAAIDAKDAYTAGHSREVTRVSLELGRLMNYSDEKLRVLRIAAEMHDVGKIGVPDAILLKPAALTEEEWTFMRRHPALGYRILAQVPYLRPAARIVLAHHERWDGGGYPRRLKAEDIPLGARIFALCDSYDAIISDRPYRKGQSPDAAFAEILRCAGEQFDPKVVEAFEALFPKWREETHGANPPLYLPAHVKGSDATGRAAG